MPEIHEYELSNQEPARTITHIPGVRLLLGEHIADSGLIGPENQLRTLEAVADTVELAGKAFIADSLARVDTPGTTRRVLVGWGGSLFRLQPEKPIEDAIRPAGHLEEKLLEGPHVVQGPIGPPTEPPSPYWLATHGAGLVALGQGLREFIEDGEEEVTVHTSVHSSPPLQVYEIAKSFSPYQATVLGTMYDAEGVSTLTASFPAQSGQNQELVFTGDVHLTAQTGPTTKVSTTIFAEVTDVGDTSTVALEASSHDIEECGTTTLVMPRLDPHGTLISTMEAAELLRLANDIDATGIDGSR
ncbi:MAG TPA: hypothetical protein VK674_06940 [Candidatus Limnocylindria bacterium]|nr:hypothetical protein [Candidatus Limnocylindria bacterium]